MYLHIELNSMLQTVRFMKLLSTDSRNYTRIFCSSRGADSRWYTQLLFYERWMRNHGVYHHGHFHFTPAGLTRLNWTVGQKPLCPCPLVTPTPIAPTPASESELGINIVRLYGRRDCESGCFNQVRPKSLTRGIWLNRDFGDGLTFHVSKYYILITVRLIGRKHTHMLYCYV